MPFNFNPSLRNVVFIPFNDFFSHTFVDKLDFVKFSYLKRFLIELNASMKHQE